MKQDLALTCIMGKGNDYLPSVPGVALQRYDGIGGRGPPPKMNNQITFLRAVVCWTALNQVMRINQ